LRATSSQARSCCVTRATSRRLFRIQEITGDDFQSHDGRFHAVFLNKVHGSAERPAQTPKPFHFQEDFRAFTGRPRLPVDSEFTHVFLARLQEIVRFSFGVEKFSALFAVLLEADTVTILGMVKGLIHRGRC
jgi:hypothetical protein